MSNTDLVPNNMHLFPEWMFEGFDLYLKDTPEIFANMAEGNEFRYNHVKDAHLLKTADEIAERIIVLGSNARLQWFLAHWEQLPIDIIKALLPRMWTDPNMVTGGPRGFTESLALDIFAKTGFMTDGPPKPEPGELTLYHGLLAGEKFYYEYDSWMNMCWTSSEAVAKRFAGKDGLYFIGTTYGEEVLARFDGRGESEYVVPTSEIYIFDEPLKVDAS